ncbi:MDR family MFS transporter [Kitasatospora sp. NPDC085879]|uniref:MDR family MFS transporter n=1 Tax=Kitasatospora sp. NPDC085879 TaxID=3154769 RepID=UPI00343DEE06
MSHPQVDTAPGDPAPVRSSGDPTPRSAREIRLVMIGLIIIMPLTTLDNLIVGTAMPTVVGDLHGSAHMAWIVTAYTLATAASTPIWGKAGDLYGRKGTLLVSVVAFLLGSALCGLAQSMNELIAFRVLQGLGAGGLMVSSISIMGAIVPLRRLGRYQSFFTAVMTAATVGGPLLGGFVTDHLNWRWTFFINAPLGIVALAFIAVVLKLPAMRSHARIDYIGALLLTACITAIVLLTSWGGHQYPWASRQILGLSVLAAASLVGFCWAERRAEEPVIPLELFKNRNFAAISVIGFIAGLALFGAVTFLPQYQQIVQGASATNSGLLLVPMMFGMLVVSLLAGRSVTRTGTYRIYLIAGTAVMTGGCLLLSTQGTGTTRLASACYMAVLGAGLGLLMQMTVLVAQNSVDLKDLGVASSSAALFRTIGGSLGVALFGALSAHRVDGVMKAAVPGFSPAGGSETGPGGLRQLPSPVLTAYQHGLSAGIHTVFTWAGLIGLVAVAASLIIREVPLRGDTQEPRHRSRAD